MRKKPLLEDFIKRIIPVELADKRFHQMFFKNVVDLLFITVTSVQVILMALFGDNVGNVYILCYGQSMVDEMSPPQ